MSIFKLALESTMGHSAASRRFYKKFIPHVRFKRNLDDFVGHPRGVAGVAEDDISNDPFVNRCIADVVEILVPGFTAPPQWHFRAIPTGDGFLIDTNYDFAHLNRLYHRNVPVEHSTLNGPFLINHIFDARVDLQIAAGYTAELVTADVTNKIIGRKFNEILTKRQRNQNEIENFQRALLQGGHALGDAINSGNRSFSEYMKLLGKAHRMREWLKSLNPDDQLLASYYREVTSSTWIESLPAKVFRFAVSTGIDAWLPGIGTAIGLADATLVDKVRLGWKPDQFVNRVVRPFVYAD